MGVIWWEKLEVLGEGWRAPAADIREKVCNRLTAGRALQEVLVCTPTRRGPTFVRTKVGKTRLGRCPKTPVAGCAGYGLIYGGSRKSIRTAHRIAPKVACGGICPFPPPPFPMTGKGLGLADKIKAAVRRSGNVRACGGGGSRCEGAGLRLAER